MIFEFFLPKHFITSRIIRKATNLHLYSKTRNLLYIHSRHTKNFDCRPS